MKKNGLKLIYPKLALLFSFVLILGFSLISCKKDNPNNVDPNNLQYLAVVETVGAPIVGNSSATCYGLVGSDKGFTVTERGFCYGTGITPSLSDEYIKCGAGSGNFEGEILNLIASTRYYVRAYATNAKGTAYGSAISFVTEAPSSPVMQVNNATHITETTASIEITITSASGNIISEYGICYGINENPDINSLHVSKNDNLLNAVFNLTGLEKDNTYYYRGYTKSTNDSIFYSSQMMFETNPPPATGSGTFEDPFNVEAGMTNFTTTPVWVKGYIVGVYETGGTEFIPNFTGPFTTNSNILIASSSEEANLSNCLPIQLPAGDIRSALNLIEHEANKGKEVMVLGNLEEYFSIPGVKSTIGYWIDGSGIVPSNGFFNEEFAGSLGTFTQYNVLGEQVWGGQTYDDGCVFMTGFVNNNRFPNEDWLISPTISLADKIGVKMIFREAMNYASDINAEAKVLVSTNYTGSGDPHSANWTELTGFARSQGSSWTFVNTSEINLSVYEGQHIHIAFKYISTASIAGTWEISRVVLTEAAR